MGFNPIGVRLVLVLVFLFSIGTVSAQWSEDIKVTDTPEDSGWANMVSDSNGNMHIVFNEKGANLEIWYTKLDNNGNTLIDERQMTASDGSWSRCPVIAVDSNDDLHVTFCDRRQGHWEAYYVKLDNNGTNLTDEIRLGFSEKDDSLTTSPWIIPAIDSNDYVHVAWSGSPDDNTTDYQTEIYYSKLYNNGTLLVNKTRLTTLASHKYNADIAIDSNDNVHVAWRDRMIDDGPPEIFYTKLDNNGNTLIDDTRLTFNPSTSIRPWITIDSDDNVNIVWSDNRLANWDIYYMKLNNNGDKIIADTRLTFDPASHAFGESYITSSPMDSEDNIHIAWSENRSDVDYTEIYYMKINNTGYKIINDTRVTYYDSHKYQGIHTALDPDDNVHITWTDNRNVYTEIYYTRSLATFNISLLQGWNLISIPLEQSNWSVDAVLASIEGNYSVVYRWADCLWTKSTARRDPLAEMGLEYGYWIGMTAPDTLELVGTIPISTTINVTNACWNLVGYPSLTPENLTIVLSPINYTVVYAYIDGVWKKSTARRDPLTEMIPGYGYWIDANEDGSYPVPPS